jgi:GNAT superfamily N-acetyltransferase
MPEPFTVRLADPSDVEALNALIRESAAELSRGFYTPEQIDAAIRFVFGVDTTLIGDRTYYAVESERRLVACGGWSRRGALYGGDQRRMGAAPVLNPATDPARIRAFFVAPAHARQGIGRLLLDVCTASARAEGYRSLELMATLPGVPLYRACGFEAVEDVTDRLPNRVAVPFVRIAVPSRPNRKPPSLVDAYAPSATLVEASIALARVMPTNLAGGCTCIGLLASLVAESVAVSSP